MNVCINCCSAHIVVATPGRLVDMFARKHTAFNLSASVKSLVHLQYTVQFLFCKDDIVPVFSRDFCRGTHGRGKLVLHFVTSMVKTSLKVPENLVKSRNGKEVTEMLYCVLYCRSWCLWNLFLRLLWILHEKTWIWNAVVNQLQFFCNNCVYVCTCARESNLIADIV